VGAKTHTQLVTELQRRVTQISSTDAGEAINRALRWINRQGSYTFQVKDPTTLSVTASTGVATTPADMDVGKGHVVYGTNGLPVRKVGIQDVTESLNFNVVSTIGWDCYIITQTKMVFFPAATGQPASVNIVYHLTTTDITGSGVSNLPKDFDDLIIDLAEAEERRIYDVGEIWPQMLARAQDQIRVLLDGYRSTSLQPMMATEAQQAIQEKATGRG
jgi:hypothetical protein